ncbi:MAG: LysR family transcriptional regulator [Clostridia bacterium]|nr:LysR family transcriptional regulator [Clostridia bacterium]
MEIRVLKYFLAIAREQSISGAAEALHLSQPTLSRQIKDMEDELGKQLLIRGTRKVTLTEEGMILRKRAEEIIDLVQKAENEITVSDETISGDIYIGTGETDAMRIIFKTAETLNKNYPNIHFHVTSGDSVDISERLDKGLFDFCILMGHIDTTKYNYLNLPMKDTWGVLMRKDSILADKSHITPEDLQNLPLILSRQALKDRGLDTWFKTDASKINIAATYNLLYNASLMVDEGMGYAVCYDKIINVTGESNLCFRPLKPKLEVGMSIVWKKYQIFSKASEKFLEKLKEIL